MGSKVFFLRTFVDDDALASSLGSSSWWDEIDESQEWQDIIFYALTAAYSLVALVALVQLIRIQLRVPEYGWTTQKIFHLMNFIVNGVRAILFGFHRDIFLFKPKVAETRFASHTIVLRRLVKVKEALKHMVISAQWGIWKNSNTARAINVRRMILDEDWWGLVNYVLEITDPIMAMLRFADSDQPCLGDIYDSMDSMLEKIKMVLTEMLLDVPSLLFFSTYTLLVLFWAEIYYQARSFSTDMLRPAYAIVNGIVYFIQVCIWIYIGIDDNSISEAIGKLFFAAVSLFAAIGFLIYGGRLFFMLRRFPLESRGRRKKLHEVGFVTAICFTCFLIRCIVVALSAFDKKADLDVLDHPILNLIYYMLVEILPSALVLFILRKLPPKRISEQYHPIR